MMMAGIVNEELLSGRVDLWRSSTVALDRVSVGCEEAT